MTNDFNSDPQLIDIEGILFHQGAFSITKEDALSALHKLVAANVPGAYYLLGHLHWRGISVSSDTHEAFRAFSVAADKGYWPAMVSLGAMYFAGIGCQSDWIAARDLYRRSGEFGGFPRSVHLGGLGLERYEFRSSLTVEINGQTLSLSDAALERLNRWLLDNKRKWIEKQSEILDRCPGAFGGITKDRLPYYGAIGGSEHFFIRGNPTISKLGYRSEWLNSEFLFDWSDLQDTPEKISFSELFSLDGENLEGVRQAYLQHSENTQRPCSRIKRFVQTIRQACLQHRRAASLSSGEFELQVLGTSIFAVYTLLYNGIEIYEFRTE